MTGQSATANVAIASVQGVSQRRDGFLSDSTWHDVLWIFTPTNALEQEHPVRIRWDFRLRSGRRFTDPSFGPLLERARTLLGSHPHPEPQHRVAAARDDGPGLLQLSAGAASLDGRRRLLALRRP